MEKLLRNGLEIEFSNIDNDLSATLSFSNKLNKFLVWFNGKLIWDSKTLKPCLDKFEDLKQKHNLTIESNEQ